MTQVSEATSFTVGTSQEQLPPDQERSQCCATDMKVRQSSKMKEIREALVASGFRALSEQAQALGVRRATAWTILKGNHKGSGLSSAVVNRMLAAPHLPPAVRAKILQYVDEKVAGHYGGSRAQLRKFKGRLSA